MTRRPRGRFDPPPDTRFFDLTDRELMAKMFLLLSRMTSDQWVYEESNEFQDEIRYALDAAEHRILTYGEET